MTQLPKSLTQITPSFQVIYIFLGVISVTVLHIFILLNGKICRLEKKSHDSLAVMDANNPTRHVEAGRGGEGPSEF